MPRLVKISCGYCTYVLNLKPSEWLLYAAKSLWAVLKNRYFRPREGVPKNMLKLRPDCQQPEDQAHGDWKAGGGR